MNTKMLEFADDEPDDYEYEAAVVEYIQKVDHIQQQIDEDQEEIDRLRAETLEILARLEAA
jgi:hypothetical protein